jgi:flagellar biosynthetic protein FliR
VNSLPADLLEWAPAFALILARVGAAMVLLPGLGESTAPATVRIGLALSITILLLPELRPLVPPVPAAGVGLGLMIAGEVLTGLWFGWLARMIVLALPVGAQFIGYMIGLSSVLQPDPELGAQSSVLGKLFEMVAPMVLLISGLYKIVLTALDGLFRLIPPGQMLPAADSAQIAIHSVVVGFSLALQLASPFVVIGIAWHLAMGQIARIVSRLQIYFVSMPGQIMAGLGLLTFTVSAIILAWHDSARVFLAALPGNG